MKIQFMGTGNMHSKRFNASVLINDSILIDAPPGISKILLQKDIHIKNINTIIITHQHVDHYFDLPILIHELSLYQNSNINIVASKNIIKIFYKLMHMAFPDVDKEILKPIKINFIALKDYANYSIDGLTISAIPVKHGNLKNCFSIILKDNIQSIGYSGDASFTKEIEYLCQNSNHIILDSTNIKGNTDHMGIDNIYYLCEKYRDKIIYTNHMSEQVENHKFKRFDNLIIPNDNDIFEI